MLLGDTLPGLTGDATGETGETLTGDATGDIIQKPGQAQVELSIRDGLIVGASVVNGGFGFTGLPEITINSDTGELVLNYYQFSNSLRSMMHLNLLIQMILSIEICLL